MAATVQNGDLSSSTRRALGYALASARRRSADPTLSVEPADLLVGALLAHPDEHGEGRVLFAHFGLTLGDVLPKPFHDLRAADLDREARHVTLDVLPPLNSEAQGLLDRARLTRGGRTSLRHLLGSLLDPSGPLRPGFSPALAARGANPTAVWEAYRKWVDEPVSDNTRDGERLAAMLAREFPPRPVDVPSYSPDRSEVTADLVGIREEVDAFAYLLASRALRPPLAIGLFGEWGSGKSFFMESVEQRIETISGEVRKQGDPAAPFWGRISQIRFNAWQYVETELWASLLDHIFEALNGQPIGLVERRQRDLEAAHQRAEAELAERSGEREKVAERLDEYKRRVADAEQARVDGLKEIRARRTAEMSGAVAEQAHLALKDAWGASADTIVGLDTRDLASAVGAARTELARSRGLFGPYWTRKRIVIATLIALVVPLIALLFDVLSLPPLVSVLGGLTVAVPAVTTLLRSATEWSRPRLDALENSRLAIEAELAARADALDAEVAAARRAVAEAEAELTGARAAQNEAGERASELQGEIERLTPARVLADFLAERSGSADYRRHLGLLSRVREDLEELAGLVERNNASEAQGKVSGESAPPNRIVLYIDDLDRCPPDKVVQVLEAVHLLLAFELFVVVVSVDSRWLTFALADKLRALTPTDSDGQRATPADYLEKIFQVPFWVQPLEAPGRRSLVHGLLEPSVRSDAEAAAARADTSPELEVGAQERAALEALVVHRGDPRLEAHALVLRPDDLTFMDSLAPLLGDTPRRVKRFVNIVQLLLAMPPELNSNGAPSDREIVAFTAALNSGMSDLAQELFMRAQRTPDATLNQALADMTQANGASPAGAAGDVARLRSWLDTAPAWSGLALRRLEVRFDLVRRLSFVQPVEPVPALPRVGPVTVPDLPGQATVPS